MKKRYFFTVLFALLFLANSCSDLLDQEPDKILSDEQVFNDPKLIKSELANFYDRISFGQHVRGSLYDYTCLDEAMQYDFDDVKSFDRNRWREYNYELVRNVNDFILKLNTVSALPDKEEKNIEGKNWWKSEARFLRAWYYFCSARSLGGVPIVGDEVFSYKPGDNVEPLRIARSTEAEIYDYIIKECQDVAKDGMLPTATTTNSSRANKWAAKMLEARAALYAASIAKYGVSTPTVSTTGMEVGIDPSKAAGYYKIALDAAEYVIANSPYTLQDKIPDDKAANFYNAVCIKSANTEVIWSRDYKFPGQTHGFTKDCLPTVLSQDASSCYLSVLLNLVEEFEPVNSSTPGQGSSFNTGSLDNPVFYETSLKIFEDRDPRLAGTVILPGASFMNEEIVLQAGQLNKNSGGKWVKKESGISGVDENNKTLITGPNGPIANRDRLFNKTGFTIRKFLDETTGAGTIGRGSEMWEVRFRISEAYLIAAEASLELNGGTHVQTLRNINTVRERAGVKALTTVTFNNIVHERRVEFSFENQRFWDMKRWRLAHTKWTGSQNDITAKRRGLWAYHVVAPGDPEDGKWYFEERDMNFLYPNALKFEMLHYYGEMANGWLNNNPKLVKNPFQ